MLSPLPYPKLPPSCARASDALPDNLAPPSALGLRRPAWNEATLLGRGYVLIGAETAYLEIVTEPQQGLITLEVGQVERTNFIVRVARHLSTPSGRHPNLFRESRIEGRADKQGIA